MTTRRSFVSSLAAVGLAACGKRRESAIPGGVLHDSSGPGHAVRNPAPPMPARLEEVGVAILGGGMAGLGAAWALERRGFHDFVVLELEPVAGGTSRSGASPVSPYPWGAHYVPVPDPANAPLIALLAEVGAVAGRGPDGAPIYAEEVLCRAPQERVFFKGQWWEGLYPRAGASRDELAELARFEQEMRRWAAWRDERGRRAFAIPRALGSDAPEVRALDAMSMDAYLGRHGYRSPRLRWLVDYACRDDFGATLPQTSAWAGIHYWASRIGQGQDEPAELLTWPEGNGRLVAHLAGVAGTRLRTAARVRDIVPDASGVSIAYDDWADGRGGAPRGLRAEHAIFAMPQFLAPHLMASAPPTPDRRAREFVYGFWMVANLSLSDRPASRGFPLSWDNVIYGSPSLGYVTATHQSGRDHGPTVLTYYRPFTDDDPAVARARALGERWESWVEMALADLRPVHPGIAGLVTWADVLLWGHAMVRPRPGFMWSEALVAASRPCGRLHFAHTDLSGMALCEEALHHGVRAAEEVLGA